MEINISNKLIHEYLGDICCQSWWINLSSGSQLSQCHPCLSWSSWEMPHEVNKTKTSSPKYIKIRIPVHSFMKNTSRLGNIFWLHWKIQEVKLLNYLVNKESEQRSCERPCAWGKSTNQGHHNCTWEDAVLSASVTDALGK